MDGGGGYELGFRLLNLAVLPWWATWLVAPRSGWARRLAGHGGIFVALGGVYTALLVASLVSAPDLPEVGTYEGLRVALSEPPGFLAGWTHYLAFDLFVGAWILRESLRLDVEPRPWLLFCFLMGPVGLLGFLVRRWGRLRSWRQLGETDLA